MGYLGVYPIFLAFLPFSNPQLGLVGICIAGAVAAYVLAYPLVAIALTIAAAILTVIGVAKVLENSNVEKPFAQQLEDR